MTRAMCRLRAVSYVTQPISRLPQKSSRLSSCAGGGGGGGGGVIRQNDESLFLEKLENLMHLNQKTEQSSNVVSLSKEQFCTFLISAQIVHL